MVFGVSDAGDRRPDLYAARLQAIIERKWTSALNCPACNSRNYICPKTANTDPHYTMRRKICKEKSCGHVWYTIELEVPSDVIHWIRLSTRKTVPTMKRGYSLVIEEEDGVPGANKQNSAHGGTEYSDADFMLVDGLPD